MFEFEILTNAIIHSTIKTTVIGPSISGPLIGAIIGSAFTWILAHGTEFYRFTKKKKEIYVILNSEVENNISNLKIFEIYHPVKKSYTIRDEWTINDFQNFYKTLNDFPILRHDNWDKFIDTVPEIFTQYEISKIIECNSKLDKLSDLARFLSNYEIEDSLNQDNLDLKELRFDDYLKITENYRTFEKNFNDLLRDLNTIKDIFSEKGKKLIFSLDYDLLLIMFIEIIGIIGFAILLKFL